jgi:hypothetical protein
LQLLFDAKCDPEFYHMQGKAFDFPNLTATLCPTCRRDYLKKHGYYERYLITIGFEGEIVIRRYSCHECKKTVSLLPSFCHPKRTYSIIVIIGLLKEYYVKKKAAGIAVACFLSETFVECSRQLLRHYRCRIEQNFNILAMTITDIYNLKEPVVTACKNVREKVRQLLSFIQSPLDDSLKIYKRTRTTYLTHKAI